MVWCGRLLLLGTSGGGGLAGCVDAMRTPSPPLSLSPRLAFASHASLPGRCFALWRGVLDCERTRTIWEPNKATDPTQPRFLACWVPRAIATDAPPHRGW